MVKRGMEQIQMSEKGLDIEQLKELCNALSLPFQEVLCDLRELMTVTENASEDLRKISEELINIAKSDNGTDPNE